MFLFLVSFSFVSYFLFFCVVFAADSVVTSEWLKRFGGTGTDEGNSVAIDSAGRVAVCGSVVDDADLNGVRAQVSGKSRA
mgnify:CR=1 FL=1